MKVVPKILRGQIGPTRATITLDSDEAYLLAHILSFAVRGDDSQFESKERRRIDAILVRLSAACEALDNDARAYLEYAEPSLYKHPDYAKTRKLFDPSYGEET